MPQPLRSCLMVFQAQGDNFHSEEWKQQERLPSERLLELYKQVRARSLSLVSGLGGDDMNLQAAEFVSPIKWNFAHCSWFFEKILLEAFCPEYQSSHPDFHRLFNSYYEGLGELYPRPMRHMISRPSYQEILDYRQSIDRALISYAERVDIHQPWDFWRLLEIGCHHEMQHQELLLMDTKYNFSFQPNPSTFSSSEDELNEKTAARLEFIPIEEGLFLFGADSNDFAYDNEEPVHKRWIEPFAIANRCVTNGEYIEFIEDGGYSNKMLWLSDSYFWQQKESRDLPLYWRREGSDYSCYDLSGVRKVQLEEPVCHLNYYEAQAFARWKGLRLPTEFEWERVSQVFSPEFESATFLESQTFRPRVDEASKQAAPINLHGNTWEWTSSDYAPYPGFKEFEGALREYNGKFMCNQRVLRGGSCVTPILSYRPSYRNFFYAEQAWCFTGLRLAQDL